MMEARPLETIPEDNRVTSDVPKTKPATAKNPGRVPSGKRLAERNRLARKQKKQAEAQKPPRNNTTTNSTNSATDQASSPNTTKNTSGYLILGVGGLIVSALGVYYQREAIMNTLRRSPNQTAPPPSSNDAVDPPPARAPKGKNRKME